MDPVSALAIGPRHAFQERYLCTNQPVSRVRVDGVEVPWNFDRLMHSSIRRVVAVLDSLARVKIRRRAEQYELDSSAAEERR